MAHPKSSVGHGLGAKDMATLLAALAHHVDKLNEEAADDTALIA